MKGITENLALGLNRSSYKVPCTFRVQPFPEPAPSCPAAAPHQGAVAIVTS